MCNTEGTTILPITKSVAEKNYRGVFPLLQDNLHKSNIDKFFISEPHLDPGLAGYSEWGFVIARLGIHRNAGIKPCVDPV